MRSEAEADRETNTSEPVGAADQQEVSVEVPSYADMVALEKALFGVSESEPKPVEGSLEWGTFKSDNYLVKNLRKAVGLFAFVIKKEAEEKMKQVEKAGKLFYGK